MTRPLLGGLLGLLLAGAGAAASPPPASPPKPRDPFPVFIRGLRRALDAAGAVQGGEHLQHLHPVPQIPADQVARLRLFHSGDTAHGLVMTLDYRTSDEVEATAEALAVVNADLRWRHRPEVRLMLLSQDPMVEARVQSALASIPSTIGLAMGDEDIWLQDLGELAQVQLVTGGPPRPGLLHTGRIKRYPVLTSALADLAGAQRVAIHATDMVEDFGGNIEATPDDLLVLGDGASEGLVEFFRARGYAGRILRVASKWLLAGHLDEVLTFVPTPGRPAPYAILRADPQRARDLLVDLDDDAWEVQLAGLMDRALSRAARHPGLLSAERPDLRLLFDSLAVRRAALRGHPMTLRSSDEHEITASSFERADTQARRHLESVDELAQELEARCGVAIPVFSLPAFFQPGWRSDGRLITLGAAVANMVVLDGHLLVPDPLLPAFQEDIRKTARALGYQVHFIPSLTQIRYGGSMHCATQVLRHADSPPRVARCEPQEGPLPPR